MSSTRFRPLLGVSLMALAMPAAAYAQDQAVPAPDAPTAVSDVNGAPAQGAEGSDEVAPSEIIVTARRRDESIQDVPAVVNAVTAEEIAKLNFRNFSEVQTVVPGLELSSNANGTGGNARLRGVNFDVNASGNNPTVEFYFNDAPITAGVILQQMYDVGQIEVLRGPQGTLRGRAAPSGSITVTSRKPDLNEIGGYTDSTANDIGTINTQAALNVPVIEGIAALRVAGVYDQNEFDRVKPINRAAGGINPRSRTDSIRVSGLVEPTDWLRFEGTYQYLDRNGRTYDQAMSFSESQPGAAASPVLIRAKDRRSIQETARILSQTYNIYNWRAEAAQFGQRLIYQGQHYTQGIFATENVDRGNLIPNRDINQVTTTNVKSTSHEIRLQNDERVFGMFDYVAGFFDNKNRTPTDLTTPTIVRLPVAFGGGVAQVVQTPVGRRGQSHEQSFFGNLTAHIGDKLELSGGLRHVKYDDTGQLIVNGALLTSTGRDVERTIYTASAKYNLSPDFLVYASTGSSFRPGISVVGDFSLVQSALERSFLELPSETSKSYEAGFKSTFLDRKLRFNVSAYHQKFENSPYRIPGTGVYYINTIAFRNAAGQVTGTAQQVAQFNFAGAVPIEVNGVEGELNYEFSRRLNIGVIASYSLGKIKNGTIPCNDLNGDGRPDSVTVAPTLAQLQARVGANNLSACTVNQRSSFQPPFSASVTSEYNLPVSDRMDAYLRGLFTFSGRSQADPTLLFDDVKSFGLLNLYAGIRDPKGMWELSLFAKNLFDTTKALTQTTPLFTSVQQLPGAIINGVPTITGAPTAQSITSTYVGITTNPPREFGVNLKFRFGSR